MATSFSLVTGNTFVNGDSATATKLNNQVNLATFSSSTGRILIGFDGSNNPADVPYTAFTTTLLAATSATAAQTVLALGSAATAATTSFLLPANNLSDVSSSATAATNIGALRAANNLSDLGNASTARSNLGLGSAATHATADFDAAGTAATLTAALNISATDLGGGVPISFETHADGSIGVFFNGSFKGFLRPT